MSEKLMTGATAITGNPEVMRGVPPRVDAAAKEIVRIATRNVDQGHGYKAEVATANAQHWADQIRRPDLSEAELGAAVGNMQHFGTEARGWSELAAGQEPTNVPGAMTPEQIEAARQDVARMTRR
jgi:hypothetical protein